MQAIAPSGSLSTEPISSESAGTIIASSNRLKLAFTLTAVFCAFICLQYFLPLRTAIRIGADEDFELAKATIVLNNFKFYTEVWNDQPPLHTFLTTQILKHLSPSVLGPRLVTSGFTAILLTAVFFLTLRVSGLVVAALTTGLLIASPGFLELSSSCMVEVPALAPAGAGLCVLLVFSRSKWHVPEIIAGVLFAVSFQIKFINVILLPLVALIIWTRSLKAASPPSPLSVGQKERETEGRSNSATTSWHSEQVRCLAKSLLVFTGGLMIGFVAINLLIGEGTFWLQLKQSWSSHFTATKSFEYGSPNDHPFQWSIFLKNWDTTIPAVLGVVVCAQQIRKAPMALIPLAWFALELVVFATHRPWWSYYYVHNAIPLCWCAAIGVDSIWKRIRRRRAPILVALFVVYGLGAGVWMVSRVYLQITGIRHSPQIYSSLVLKEIARYKPFSKFLYAAEPIYSFHAGIPVPPKLGIIPLKRLWSGDMTNEKIAAELWATKPGVILLANDTRAVPFDDLLAAEYRLVYQDNKHRLYAQKEVIAQARKNPR